MNIVPGSQTCSYFPTRKRLTDHNREIFTGVLVKEPYILRVPKTQISCTVSVYQQACIFLDPPRDQERSALN